MLSGRGLCDELITRPEESYRLCRVVVCDQETSKEEAKSPLKGCEYKSIMGICRIECFAYEGSKKLRIPDFMTTAQDGGKFVSLTHRSPLPPGNTPGTHSC